MGIKALITKISKIDPYFREKIFAKKIDIIPILFTIIYMA